MPTYPTSLPGPSQPLAFDARERRVGSPGDGPVELRGRFREQIVDVHAARWIYTPAEMQVFRDWWKTDLIDGLLWFDVMLPGFGGWQQRMARFVSGSKREHRAAGIYEVTADLEINHSRLPTQPRPVLLMHFDGDFADATGNSTFAPEGGYSFAAAADPAFGQMVVATDNGRAAASSIRSLAIGSRKFTIEGRAHFALGDIGGQVLAKNYWPSNPGLGVFRDDFSVGVTPDNVGITWTGQVTGRAVSFAPIVGVPFTWSISDDGTNCYFHVNGELRAVRNPCAADAVPPPVSGSSISVLNKLQGFSGDAPDWSGGFYRGGADELRMWLDAALYGPEDYEPATAPFSYP